MPYIRHLYFLAIFETKIVIQALLPSEEHAVSTDRNRAFTTRMKPAKMALPFFISNRRIPPADF